MTIRGRIPQQRTAPAARAVRTVAGALFLLAAAGCFGAKQSADTAAVPVAPPPAAPTAFTPPPVPYAYAAAFRPDGRPAGSPRLTAEERAYYQMQLEAVQPPVRGPMTVLPVRRQVPAWEDEFADVPYHGPAAPALPPLPGDRDDPYLGSRPVPPAAHAAGRASARTAVDSTVDSAAAVVGDERVAALFQRDLRPIEQLVYGGEHPEIATPPPYRFQPRDGLRVSVRGHPEFGGEVRLSDDGRFTIPGTEDRLAVRGRTADEIAGLVRRTLAPYVRGNTPEVLIEPVGVRGGHYFVFGAVRHPGRFPMGGEPVRLSDAVLAANWEALPGSADARVDELGPAFPAAHPRGRFVPPANADLGAVEIYTPHRSRPSRSVHDLAVVFGGGAHGDDPYVLPGQVVIVPSTDPEQNPAWMCAFRETEAGAGAEADAAFAAGRSRP